MLKHHGNGHRIRIADRDGTFSCCVLGQICLDSLDLRSDAGDLRTLECFKTADTIKSNCINVAMHAELFILHPSAAQAVTTARMHALTQSSYKALELSGHEQSFGVPNVDEQLHSINFEFTHLRNHFSLTNSAGLGDSHAFDAVANVSLKYKCPCNRNNCCNVADLHSRVSLLDTCSSKLKTCSSKLTLFN